MNIFNIHQFHLSLMSLNDSAVVVGQGCRNFPTVQCDKYHLTIFFDYLKVSLKIWESMGIFLYKKK